MAPKSFVAAMLAILMVWACDSSDPKALISEGQRALGASDFKSAQSKFDEALGVLEPSDAQYIEATLGRIQALIPTEAERAADEFLMLSAAHPAQIGESEFAFISGQMVSARKCLEAIDVLHAGIQRFGLSSAELVSAMERLKKEAAADKRVDEVLRSVCVY